jgi:hypothetical protein
MAGLQHAIMAVFPAPFVEKSIFSPVYVLGSFFNDQVPIGMCV